MNLLFENWRKYLKEEVVDAEWRFLQKAAKDSGEILEFKEKDEKYIVTLWKPHTQIDPYGKYKGEKLEELWNDIIDSGSEKTIYFHRTFEAEMDTKEDALEYAKDMVEALQDVTKKQKEDYEASIRGRYEEEEREARRNPKPPMTPEEHEQYMSLYDDDDEDDDNVISLFENWREYLSESHVPNTNVVLILKPSDIHGKGIFAGEHIPKGTDLGVSHIRRGGENWDIPPLGRYHNHSDKPNCASIADAPLEGENYSRKMVASRDISPDEEITTNYKLQPDLEQPGEWAIQ